jgi:hypothetical protein
MRQLRMLRNDHTACVFEPLKVLVILNQTFIFKMKLKLQIVPFESFVTSV